jgi:hypothetical protein
MYIDYFANMSINVESNFHSNRKSEFGYENWIWSFGIINFEKDGKSSKFMRILGSFIWKINKYRDRPLTYSINWLKMLKVVNYM